MRRQSAPTGLRLAVFLLCAATLKISSSQYLQIDNTATQEHLVCKKPESQICVTWDFGPVDPDIIIEESPSNATQFCGLSNLKRILPHRKFITVKSLAREGKSNIIFCNGFTKLKGDVVNWKQVEKALNALSRSRRQTSFTPRGRYRGQTQSQYLAIDRGNGKDEGKAEAHSAADSSRASVSGNSGMGQAQSQSIYDPNCDDCYGKSDHEVESLKRGPYIPGGIGGGNRYAPTNGFTPGQGGSKDPLQPGVPVDVTRPSAGYRPGGNGVFGPGYTPGGNDGYGPNRQIGGNGGYGPGQIGGSGPLGYGHISGATPDSYRPGQANGPGSGYAPSLGNKPGGSQGYSPDQGSGPSSRTIPGGGQGGSGGYGPGQGSGPGSRYGPSSGTIPGGSQGGSGGYGPAPGTTPGGSQRGNGGYEPGQGSGSSSGYGPPSGTTHSGGQGGVYGPTQGSGPGSGYGPSIGTTPGGNQGNGGYGPGQGSGLGPGYGPSSGTTPSGGQGGNVGYGPSQGSGPGSGYGPSGSPPSGGQGGNVGYVPGQGSGPGPGYGPSSGTIPGSEQGGNVGYGPGQGQLRPSSGYAPSPGSTPGGSRVGSNGYGASPGSRPGTTSYGPFPGGYGPGQGSGSSSGYGPPSGTIPSGGQGGNGGYGPSHGSGPGSSSGPIYPYTPGLNNSPSLYGSVQNRNPSVDGSYPVLQGPQANNGYGPAHGVIPGSNIPIPPGIGYGQTISGSPGTGASNWPLALGPYPGPPGSSVYCCVVPNSYGQNAGPGGNILPSTGTRYPTYDTEKPVPGIPSGGSELQSPYGTKPSGVPNNLYGSSYKPDNTGSTNVQGPQGPNNLLAPGIYDKEIIGGPVSREPYGIGNGISGPYSKDAVGGPGTYVTGSTGTPGGQNGAQGPGIISTVPGGGTGNQNSMLGPSNYGSVASGRPGGQYGMQGPGNFGTGSTGALGQNGMQGPGNFGTGSTGALGQNGMQGPGNYGAGTTGGSGNQNGVQGPGNFGTGSTVGLGQNGIQGPGNYGPGTSGGSGNQNGMQGPYNFGTVPTGGTGNQNGMQGASNFGTGPTGGSGNQNGIQRPTNFGTGPTGGPGNQNGMQGPSNFGTGPTSGTGNQNGMQGPLNFGTGPTGGAGPHSGMQSPGNYGAGTSGQPDQIGNQGPGIYGTVQGPGTYGTANIPGSQGDLQRPGSYDTGSPAGPNSQIGGQGSATYNGQNVPNNQRGGGGNAETTGGNTISGPGISGTGPTGYPVGTQFPPSSQGPGIGNSGFYGQQPQGPLNPSLSGTQTGFDNQGNPVQGNEYNGIPQNYVDPNSIPIDGDDSEAEAIVNQAANGTTASATSKGGNDKERAQTHVHGTYTGGGSFQAQAQITGENKGAESEVSGGKKGASSSATGSGRNNKSQASVQLGSETGSIQTQSQSNGAMHSSNSQVQGSVKGGMADAQAKGPGSTSSQAQIGFTPYKDGDKVHELLQRPFTGGGIASAQSTGRTGQSQSQLHGIFKYAISYNGAAQAGASLDKDAIFPNRLNFEKIDVFDESQKNINVNSENPQNEVPSTESIPLSEVPSETKINTTNEDKVTTEKASDETMKNSESRYMSHTHLDHHQTDTTSTPSPTGIGNRRSFQSGYENGGADYEYTTDKDEIPPEEYDTDPGYGIEGNDATDVDQGVGEEFPNYDEYNRDYQTHQSLQSPHRQGLNVQQSTGGNTQHIVLGSLNNHNAKITQKNSEKPDESKVYQPGERVPGTGGYRIPIGFTGSVKSVASKENTYVIGSEHSPSQAQTVTLTPGTGKVNYVHSPGNGKYVSPKDLRSLQNQNPKDDRYVSVSKSVTRALDGENNIRKQYSHTYYTKSSSCGYFTFTCTMVSGIDGRKKVCKPKIPTNPDGTPIRC